MLVTNRSSPTSCTFLPRRSVRCFQPSQSSSAMPSSMLMIGYLSHQVASMSVNSSAVSVQAFALEVVLAVLVELAGGAVEAERDLLRRRRSRPCRSLRRISWIAASWLPTLGAKPPSSPTAVVMPRVVEDLLQRMEHLGAVAHRFAEASARRPG